MKFEETAEYKLGDTAQVQWAQHRARTGCVVAPLYGARDVAPSTKAPMLFAASGLLVAPDLLVARPGSRPQFDEVKAKAKPGWFRNGQRWEHGIDYAIALEYADVATRSGLPVLLVVFEVQSPAHPLQESPLTGPPCWLTLPLKTALAIGEHRPSWPGGVNSPHRRGRHGKGGLLWPRTAMVERVLA